MSQNNWNILKHSTPIEREVFQTYGKELQTQVEGFETHYNKAT